MNNILSKEEIGFNELEQNIFKFVCCLGGYITEQILEKKDKEVAKEITKLYKQCKIEEMLKYIKTYADSVETKDENNKEYLVQQKYH